VGRTIAIVILGLVLLAPPASADSGTDANALTVASGVLMTVACWIMDGRARDGESPQDGFDRRGWLLGLGGSYAVGNFKDAEERIIQSTLRPFPVSLSVDDGKAGFQVRAGRRCNKRYSAELEAEWTSTFEGQISNPQQGVVTDVSFDPLFISANSKGYLLTGRFQPFVLVGVGSLSVESTATTVVAPVESSKAEFTALALRLGGGLDVYATKHIVVDMEASYVLPVSGRTEFEYISIGLGLQYRF
jgi:opacity protein-like surface antigen